MTSRENHPFGGRDDDELTDREWRAVMTWRMRQVERQLAGIAKAIWTLAGSIIAGVVVYFVTVGHP